MSDEKKNVNETVGLDVLAISTGAPVTGLEINNSSGGIGAEVRVQAQSGGPTYGVRAVAGGSGPSTGLRVIQSGPGVGLRVIVRS